MDTMPGTSYMSGRCLQQGTPISDILFYLLIVDEEQTEVPANLLFRRNNSLGVVLYKKKQTAQQ